jgi:hypothetical protein
MTMRGIAKEFPDFPIAYAPELPDGWEDTSWHHDECPSYSAHDAQVFINLNDKFCFIICDAKDGETYYMTNDWKECVDYVNELKIEGGKQ